MLKLIKSSFYNETETKQALADFILGADILSMNKECLKYEKAFAAKQGRKHAVFVSNGSAANFLLIQSLMNMGKLRKGSKVGFSALTWPTNVMPLIQLGIQPVAIDCSLTSLNITPDNLRHRIQSLDALFLTNVLGFCDDIEAIAEICKEYNILLIEDNCESLGSAYHGTLLGNYGLASTFSFFVGHHLSTIEGGMVCTDDDQLWEALIISRAHGWDRNLPAKSQEKLRSQVKVDSFYAKYTFYDLASNFRPTEINGFLGNRQLGYWDEIVSKRAANFAQFNEALQKNDDFYHYNLDGMNIVSNFAMPVICKTIDLANSYKSKFEASAVEIRPVIAGCMTEQPFYKKYVASSEDLPNSMLIHRNGFYFGNNPDMTPDEIGILCDLLKR